MVKRKPSKLFSPLSRFTFFFVAVFMLQTQSHVHVSSPINVCVFFFSTIAQAGASGHRLLALQQRCVPTPFLHCTCWVVRSLLVWSLQPACLLYLIHIYIYIHDYLAVRA